MDGGRVLHHAASVTKLRALAAFWGVAIIVGAAWLQTVRPHGKLIARVLRSEALHVSAHLVLYSSLAAIVWLASSGRRPIVAAVTATVGVLQEGAQSILYGRPPGREEAFDLCVDAVALVVALLLCARFVPTRRFSIAPSDASR